MNVLSVIVEMDSFVQVSNQYCFFESRIRTNLCHCQSHPPDQELICCQCIIRGYIMNELTDKTDQLSDSFFVILSFSDVDECMDQTNVCDRSAICKNTNGSYTCECQIGYSMDGNICTGK